MEKVFFKSQLLQANSHPQLKTLVPVLEPLIDLVANENTYRGSLLNTINITSIFSWNENTDSNESAFFEKGFALLVAVFSNHWLQQIAMHATGSVVMSVVTPHVRRELVNFVIFHIIKLIFSALTLLLNGGMRITKRLLFNLYGILVLSTSLYIFLIINGKHDEVADVLTTSYETLMEPVDAMLKFIMKMIAETPVILDGASKELRQLNDDLSSDQFQNYKDRLIRLVGRNTEFHTKLLTEYLDPLNVHVTSMTDLIQQINDAEYTNITVSKLTEAYDAMINFKKRFFTN